MNNTSRFMDKQIMDLSQSNNNINNNNDFIGLISHQKQQEQYEVINDVVNDDDVDVDVFNHNHKTSEILPNYDFQPIHRSDHTSLDNHINNNLINNPIKPNSLPLRSYSSLDHVEPDKILPQKAQKVNDTAILSEIDRTMKKHTDTLMHAIDSISAKLSQMESRTRHLEHSVDELKESVSNNHGRADGKLRQLENILLEVQTGVQMLKDKQEVMEGHMQLAKLQISKTDQSPEFPNAIPQGPVQSTPLPPNAPPPSQLNNHPPLAMASHFPLSTPPTGPHRDPYLPLPTPTPDASSQHYQILHPGQNQQLPPPPAQTQPPQPQPQPQQYQSSPTPPYPQPPQPPQQHHFPPSPGHRLDENPNPGSSPYVPSQTYLPNLHQPTSQSSNVPYYGGPSPMYESPSPPAGPGFQSAYGPPSGPNEPFPYGGPPSHYTSGSSVKPIPRSPRGGGTGNYPQLPTARVLPQAIPTASGVSGGSSSGGSGNKVPIDDVVDKVTTMGFSRDQVRATVRRLTENGQSVDLNVVLDKLMNDADVQPPRGWLGR